MEQDFFDIPEALWRQISRQHRFRGLLIRWARRSENFLAMLQLATPSSRFSKIMGLRTCSYWRKAALCTVQRDRMSRTSSLPMSAGATACSSEAPRQRPGSSPEPW